MVKKMLATVITVCMIIAMLPAGIAYGTEHEENGITYSLDTIDEENVATVTGCDEYKGGVVKIPTKISYDGKDYTVTSIGDQAFLNRAIEGINFEENSELTSIGDSAFHWCENLTSIEIPASVTSIGAQAFCKSSIKKIEFEENSKLVSIGEGAFSQCEGLESIKIPARVESIATSAFSNCANLTKFEVDGDNEHFSADNGVLFKKNKTTLVKWPAKNKDTNGNLINEYAIPQTVETIEDRAFDYCKLETIVIPNSVTTIDTNAFINSEKLQKIIFDSKSNLTTIGDDAFFNCQTLTSIVIPKKVISIGARAFAGCNALKIITIPKSVKNIDGEAFGSKTDPTTVIFEGTEEEWEALKENFPDTIKKKTPICVDVITLTCEGTTDNSATLKATLTTTPEGKLAGAIPQYRVKNGNDWSAWQTGATITGLSPETEYTFEARYVDEANNPITNPVSTIATTAKKRSSSSSSRSTPIITVTGNDGGSVVYDRINRTITITPKEGYFVKEVSVGGEAVTVTEDTMVLENIYGWSRVAVSFEKMPEPAMEPQQYVQDWKLTARSEKTPKGNIRIRVTALTDGEGNRADLAQLTEEGYTVKYQFYRSTKKSAGYTARLEKAANSTFTNTEGKAGTKYYYKVCVTVYDAEGKLVAKTDLKQCRYASRTWSK